MSVLSELAAIDATRDALNRVDQLHLECPQQAIAERHVIKQASIDLKSALEALLHLYALDDEESKQEVNAA